MVQLDFTKAIKKAANSNNYAREFWNRRFDKEALNIMNRFINEIAIKLIKGDCKLPEGCIPIEESFSIGYCTFLVKKQPSKLTAEEIDHTLFGIVIYATPNGRTIFPNDLNFKGFDFEVEIEKPPDYSNYCLDCKPVVTHYLRQYKKKITGKSFAKIQIFINVMGKYLTREVIAALEHDGKKTLSNFLVRNVIQLMLSGKEVDTFMTFMTNYKSFRSAASLIEVTDEKLVDKMRLNTELYNARRRRYCMDCSWHSRKDHCNECKKPFKREELNFKFSHLEKMMRSQIKEGQLLGKESVICLGTFLEYMIEYLISNIDGKITPEELGKLYSNDKKLQTIDRTICGLDLLK